LPSVLPCSIVIGSHQGESQKSILAELLRRRSALPVTMACNCELKSSTVYVVPPGTHLRVQGRRLELLYLPPIHFLRPHLDSLFQSVAEAFGPRAVGVVLSGMGHDGAEGLKAIKAAGGTTIAQDPQIAEFPEMPKTAIQTGLVDLVLSSDTIGEKLVELCMEAGAAEWPTNSR
jgi:two-component system, chemotaxis family, protein-glutamate methylesterase/glutaminase